jgi:predicted RNA-binding protein with TRAM domain
VRTVRSDLRRVKSQAGRKALITLFVVGWALIVVASDYLLLATYNAMGDHGQAVCRPMLVIKKSVSGGGAHAPIMKYFVLAPEAQPGDTIKVAVTPADYRQAREDRTEVNLCIKPGALSMPWVSDCRLVR